MSENCTHNCSTCSQDCAERDLKKAPHELSKIKKVIGIVSGKGGVGKSLTTAMLAVTAARNGFKTAIMDADITGPSIPKMFASPKRRRAAKWAFSPCSVKRGSRSCP